LASTEASVWNRQGGEAPREVLPAASHKVNKTIFAKRHVVYNYLHENATEILSIPDPAPPSPIVMFSKKNKQRTFTSRRVSTPCRVPTPAPPLPAVDCVAGERPPTGRLEFDASNSPHRRFELPRPTPAVPDRVAAAQPPTVPAGSLPRRRTSSPPDLVPA
jgi:hypothetical protein